MFVKKHNEKLQIVNSVNSVDSFNSVGSVYHGAPSSLMVFFKQGDPTLLCGGSSAMQLYTASEYKNVSFYLSYVSHKTYDLNMPPKT